MNLLKALISSIYLQVEKESVAQYSYGIIVGTYGRTYWAER